MKIWMDEDGNTLELRTDNEGWLTLTLVMGRERWELDTPVGCNLRDAYRTLYHWHRRATRMHRLALGRPARLELWA